MVIASAGRDGDISCYEPLERFIGIMEPRQDNGKQQRHVSPMRRNCFYRTSRVN